MGRVLCSAGDEEHGPADPCRGDEGDGPADGLAAEGGADRLVGRRLQRATAPPAVTGAFRRGKNGLGEGWVPDSRTPLPRLDGDRGVPMVPLPVRDGQGAAKSVTGFCCQAPAGLRLGRLGESNRLVVVQRYCFAGWLRRPWSVETIRPHQDPTARSVTSAFAVRREPVGPPMGLWWRRRDSHPCPNQNTELLIGGFSDARPNPDSRKAPPTRR